MRQNDKIAMKNLDYSRPIPPDLGLAELQGVALTREVFLQDTALGMTWSQTLGWIQQLEKDPGNSELQSKIEENRRGIVQRIASMHYTNADLVRRSPS